MQTPEDDDLTAEGDADLSPELTVPAQVFVAVYVVLSMLVVLAVGRWW